jgi:hypothetical protein
MAALLSKAKELKIGDRVGALVPDGWNDEEILLIGYGVYVSDEYPPESFRKVFSKYAKWGKVKKILLDNGDVLWEPFGLFLPELVVKAAVLVRETVTNVRLLTINDEDGNLDEIKFVDPITLLPQDRPARPNSKEKVGKEMAEAIQKIVEILSGFDDNPFPDFHKLTLRLFYGDQEVISIGAPAGLEIDPSLSPEEIKQKVEAVILKIAQDNPEMKERLLSDLGSIQKMILEKVGKKDLNPNSKLN